VDPLNVNQVPQKENNEIDLLELFESLWREKLLIVAITALITLVGGLYAFNIPPTYRASVRMLPPSSSDLAELSKFHHLDSSESQSQSQSQSQLQSLAYTQFLQLLKSNQIRNEFLRDEELQKALFKEPVSLQKARKTLDKLAVVNEPKKGPPVDVELTFDAQDPNLAANAANKLVQLALNAYRNQVSAGFVSAREQNLKRLENQLKISLDAHSKKIRLELLKLNEALAIANKIGLRGHKEGSYAPLINFGNSSLVTEEVRYLYSQGADALRAEIDAVAAREKDLSMVSGLIELEKKIALLKAIEFDPTKVIPLTIDSVAEPPEQRIKPKRSSIVALSVFVGGILAIMFVLIRNVVRNRKTAS
jgi:chain length determinant protein (polysaccharide antigen chain regulator)